jgi:Kef-type K+ transport system membrane component KefB
VSTDQITSMFLAIGLLLGVARLLGELARALRQPTVLGELLAGVLLGPTLLGRYAPDFSARVLPSEGPVATVLSGMSTVAVALFLLVAGLEVDLSTIWRQGRRAVAVSLSGIAVPFALGFALAAVAPAAMGAEPNQDLLVFALFFATALSISALPVIAKTLLDLNLFRSDLGMVVVASAIFNDLVGWIVFAVVLAMMGKATHGPGLAATIGLTLAFAGTMLTAGRWLVNRLLPWLQAHASWPGGVLGFTATLAFFSAAFTEWIGLHAVFGAFLFGVALGDSRHLREQTRNTLEQFVSFIFAPLFFATLGLRVDFVQSFDLGLVLTVLLVASLGKVGGAGGGALLAGMPARQAWAVGCAMNARGAMEMVLGLVALQSGVIGERLFVALVVMALMTSVVSGPLMQRLLRRERSRQLLDYLGARTFVPALSATTPGEAIAELVGVAASSAGVNRAEVERAVLAREAMMSTGLELGVAAPHARIAGLPAPLVALGLSEAGLDFDTLDGSRTRIVVLVLTPAEDEQVQLELLADIARSFRGPSVVERARQAQSFVELKAALRAVDSAPARH